MLTKQTIFDFLEKVNRKPKPFEYYTTPALWCDSYISKQMLALHISDDIELASRKKEFIDRSAKWMVEHFHINSNFKICDFGCGPGLYTMRFAKYGADVTGVDFSKTSIEYAKEQAEKKKLNIKYILQDYLEFETNKRFDLIAMIYCDFCVLNPEQRKLLLSKFHALLEVGGKLMLDVSSYAQYDSRLESCVCEASSGDDGFWSKEPYHVFHNHFKYEKEHLLLDKFTIVENSSVRENYNWMQCYTIEQITEEFELNGLKVVESYANVAGDPCSDKSTEIALVAEKL